MDGTDLSRSWTASSTSNLSATGRIRHMLWIRFTDRQGQAYMSEAMVATLFGIIAIWAVFSVPWQLALVIAGCITPTDPVLANSIVKGKFAEKHIPYHVRLLISAESAINDGLGVPLVFLPVYLWRISNTGEAIGWWILNVIIYQITLCVIFGILIGYASLERLNMLVERMD
ncbi:hypothetical protein BSLG_005910 [Batrachochytrium salamandrivorans]|nr:hypothetical protein BSLG_005910 [Batrachochytrium salamandrivorans]